MAGPWFIHFTDSTTLRVTGYCMSTHVAGGWREGTVYHQGQRNLEADLADKHSSFPPPTNFIFFFFATEERQKAGDSKGGRQFPTTVCRSCYWTLASRFLPVDGFLAGVWKVSLPGNPLGGEPRTKAVSLAEQYLLICLSAPWTF